MATSEPSRGDASNPVHKDADPLDHNEERQIVASLDEFVSEIDEEGIDHRLSEIDETTESLDPGLRESLDEIARLSQSTKNEEPPTTGNEGGFTLTDADDEMTMFLAITPPTDEGEPVTAERVLATLEERGIQQGINVDAIREAADRAAKGETVENVTAVTGRAAQPGRDESIEVFARIATSAPVEKVDLERLAADSIDPMYCLKDDPIARRLPPVEGTDGYDATGRTLPAPSPKRVSLNPGDNVRVVDDAFFADTNGVVIVERDQIMVRRLLILSRDLAANHAPIDFDGDVHVMAAARSGASIRATGDIMIEGFVEAAHVESTGGRVQLKHGVAGRHKATIRARDDILCRFAENATLLAGRDIVIAVGAMRCHLVAGRSIRIADQPGRLQGGIAVAAESIEVVELGTPNELPTPLTLGLDTDVLKRVTEIDLRKNKKLLRQQRCNELADRVKRFVGDPAKLKPEQLESYTKLCRVQVLLSHELAVLEQKRQSLLSESSVLENAHVRVTKKMHPGASFSFGAECCQSDQTCGPSRIFHDGVSRTIKIRQMR